MFSICFQYLKKFNHFFKSTGKALSRVESWAQYRLRHSHLFRIRNGVSSLDVAPPWGRGNKGKGTSAEIISSTDKPLFSVPLFIESEKLLTRSAHVPFHYVTLESKEVPNSEAPSARSLSLRLHPIVAPCAELELRAVACAPLSTPGGVKGPFPGLEEGLL